MPWDTITGRVVNILAILCVRNEGAFLLDWLAHHLACGVSHVLVLSNDYDDGSDAMLDRLAVLGHVTHIRNDGPYDRAGVQFTGLNRAADTPLLAAADWVLPLDIDEFVNVHVGDHTLHALIAALPDATAITLTWRTMRWARWKASCSRPTGGVRCMPTRCLAWITGSSAILPSIPILRLWRLRRRRHTSARNLPPPTPLPRCTPARWLGERPGSRC